MAVARGVVEARRAVEVRRGRERDVAVAVEGHRAARRIADRDDRKRVAVRVRIVRQQIGREDNDGRVLSGRSRIVGGYRRVVDRRDRNSDRARGAVGAVGDRIGEARRAVEARARREQDIAIAVERHRAVTGAAHGDEGDRIALGVRIVGEEGRGENRDGRVFVSRRRVGFGRRRIVDGGDGDRDGARIGAGVAVGEGVVEAGRAAEIGGRREHHVAVHIEGRHAVDGAMNRTHPQEVAFHVAVVGQQARSQDCDGGVFRCRRRVVERLRWVVVGGHGDRHRCRRGGSVPVAGRVVECEGAARVHGRRVDDVAVAVEGRGTVDGVAEGRERQRLAVHVPIVDEQVGREEGGGDALDGHRRIVRRHGGVVDR